MPNLLLLLISSGAEAVLHEHFEQARARRRRAGRRVGTAGRRVRGRLQLARWLPGPRRPGTPLPGGRHSPGGLGAAAAQAAAPPGRPGMGVAGRTGRHRTGRMQRTDDPGHPGRRSRQCRGHHRSGPADHHRRRRDHCGPPPHRAGPPRRNGGDRRIRSGPARRRHRTDLEPSRTAVVGGRARWCRRLIPAGRAAAAPARRPRRHRLCLRPGGHLAASHRCRDRVLPAARRSCAHPPLPSWPRWPTSRSRSPPWSSSPGTGQWNASGWTAPDCSTG